MIIKTRHMYRIRWRHHDDIESHMTELNVNL